MPIKGKSSNFFIVFPPFLDRYICSPLPEYLLNRAIFLKHTAKMDNRLDEPGYPDEDEGPITSTYRDSNSLVKPSIQEPAIEVQRVKPMLNV